MSKPNRIIYLALFSFITTTLYAENNKNLNNLMISKDVKHDISLPLRDMAAKANKIKPHYKKSIGRQILENISITSKNSAHPFVPVNGFEGIGKGLPNYEIEASQPDLNLAVGENYILQYANPDIAVFNRSSGIIPEFPTPASSFWKGFGGDCEQYATGRPSLKYDELSNRWVVSQLASQDQVNGPFFNCVAISTSSDVTGTYFRYAFQLNGYSNFLRIAVWPNAYYLGLNTSINGTYGSTICALERDQMLAGHTASMVCKQFTQTQFLTPATLLGNALVPPDGTPGYFIGLNPPNNLVFYKFYVDFANQPNTDVFAIQIPVDTYQPACQDYNGVFCAIQPETTNKLNLVSNRILPSIGYRQFLGYGSIVIVHSVDGPQQPSDDPVPLVAPALRWYELRVNDSEQTRNPVIYQQATLAPDTKNRFGGSISIDSAGNIGLAYTVSSTRVYPSSELAWRTAIDPLNTMRIQAILTGTGSQIDDVSDWTPGTKLLHDPFNICSMFFTSEYLKENGSFNWNTKLINFILPCPVVPLKK